MGIILSTIYFYFLMSVFGDNGAASRLKAFVIVLAGGVVQAICLFKFPEQVGLLGTVVLSTAAMVLLLVAWCRTSLWSATKICACFLAGIVVIQIGIDALSTQARI